jgi:hypothetical protein
MIHPLQAVRPAAARLVDSSWPARLSHSVRESALVPDGTDAVALGTSQTTRSEEAFLDTPGHFAYPRVD